MNEHGCQRFKQTFFCYCHACSSFHGNSISIAVNNEQWWSMKTSIDLHHIVPIILLCKWLITWKSELAIEQVILFYFRGFIVISKLFLIVSNIWMLETFIWLQDNISNNQKLQIYIFHAPFSYISIDKINQV